MVSWPDTAGAVDLLGVGPDPDRQEVIDDPQSLSLRTEQAPLANCEAYWDKTLRADNDEYVRCVQDPPRSS
eukprot:1255578-Pyramimonas_sp.AAC.1